MVKYYPAIYQHITLGFTVSIKPVVKNNKIIHLWIGKDGEPIFKTWYATEEQLEHMLNVYRLTDEVMPDDNSAT